MVMPGRIFSPIAGNRYRYSINGQEKSDEIAPNTTTAKYWEYDSRITRRWNIDPKGKIGESPYLVFGGNPIGYSDPFGDSSGTKINGRDYALINKDNKIGYYDRETGKAYTGKLNAGQQKILDATNKMASSNSKEIRDRLSTVLSSKKYVDIKYGIASYSSLNENTGELNWSGTVGSSIMRNNGGSYTMPGNTINQTIDEDIDFAHEFLGHAYQYVTGNLNHNRIDFKMNGVRLGAPKAAEADAVNIANGYALATNRASMISHVYIETTFYSLHGKQISKEQYDKLPEDKLKEVENPIFYHQIPVNFNLSNSDSQKPYHWRLKY
jgi:hypothetical protein